MKPVPTVCRPLEGLSCPAGWVNPHTGAVVYATEEVIGAARADDREAVASMRTYAGWLAEGIATMVHLLDPELVVLSGGLTANNPLLLECLRTALPPRLLVPVRRAWRGRGCGASRSPPRRAAWLRYSRQACRGPRRSRCSK